MAVSPDDLARTLLQRHRTQRERHAQRAAGLRTALTEGLRAARKRGVRGRAWLVGSLARGDYGEASDVDVVVQGVTVAEATELAAELSTRLEAPLDLLRLEDLPEIFAARVRSQGVELP